MQPRDVCHLRGTCKPAGIYIRCSYSTWVVDNRETAGKFVAGKVLGIVFLAIFMVLTAQLVRNASNGKGTKMLCHHFFTYPVNERHLGRFQITSGRHAKILATEPGPCTNGQGWRLKPGTKLMGKTVTILEAGQAIFRPIHSAV